MAPNCSIIHTGSWPLEMDFRLFFPVGGSPFEVKWPKMGIRGSQLPVVVVLQLRTIFHLLYHFLGPKCQDMSLALKEANVWQTWA